MVCLAVIFYGIRVMLQDQDLPRMTFSTWLRIVIVVGFAFNMAAVVSLPFIFLQDMLAIGTGGWLPWIQIDMAIGSLFGFGPSLALFQGMLGLLGAALFTSATGMFMFLFGFLVIFSLLGLVFRAVYNYLNAIVLIGFLMAISPLVIPIAVFGYGERYFRKWLDLLISSMMQPFMLFAFLWIFLGLVNVYISSIFSLLGGNDFSAFWRHNQPFFTWAMTTDPQLFQKFEAQGLERGQPLVQSLMNPMLGRSMDMSLITHAGVNFGPNSMAIMQQLILYFISMAITIYLLRSMLDAIPQLADDISGTSTGLGFERIDLFENIKKAVAKVATKGSG
jgi:type IV secretory pathway VirB6-like protein